MRAFLALAGNEAHGLAFGERLEAVNLNSAEENEEIRAAVRRGDETKTLAVVEPLDRTSLTIRHNQFLTNLMEAPRTECPQWAGR